MAPAPSEARNSAVAATSASRGERRSILSVSGLTQAVVQVGHPILLHNLRVLQEQRRSGVVAEEPNTGTEHDRYQAYTHLVDQPGLECLPADVARDRKSTRLNSSH